MSDHDQKPVTALGLMSGTSMDGIDVALITSDGHRVLDTGPAATFPYQENFRAQLRAAILVGHAGSLDQASLQITLLHADAVREFMRRHGITADRIDLVGFHGHTVAHDPAAGRTVQIGDGAELARLIKIDVVDQFRLADVAAGGQGAPLAPLYHAALAAELSRPLAVLNIGGVANVTWIGPAPEGSDEPQLLAFDTGPGNALLDDWVAENTGETMDEDGVLAADGVADQGIVERFLAQDYFRRPAPKSLDRDDFNLDDVAGLTTTDGAATLVDMTVRAVAVGARLFPTPPAQWLATGGGRKNPEIMRRLSTELGVPVEPVEKVGWSGDALEAQAFAFLAIRSRRGLSLSLPTTTGVEKPLTGGTFHPA